jgi:hypothetical protein
MQGGRKWPKYGVIRRILLLRMTPHGSAVFSLLPALKALVGPWGIALFLASLVGWNGRALAQARTDLVTRVSQLDSATVKRPQFERTVERLEAVAARQDSTNALLRRYICRDAPTICP